MCGICGIYNFKSNTPVSSDQISKMYGVMKYRGPDDEGYYIDNISPLGFGHCRLSILDTSSKGRQPMISDDGTIILTYNGEVYNYVELRERLLSKGYHFSTGTDTEVIIQMYREYGEGCLDFFIGMFSFALWDKKNNKLFMARDRLGIKPFYYSITDDGIVFASEIKSILTALSVKPEANYSALDSYMSFGYVPGENTTFNNIHKMLPGRYMSISDNYIQIRQYWKLNFNEEADRGETYYIEKTKELIFDASKIRLRSDVPLGVFLSGGIDSSTVVALLAGELTEPIKTFSVAYDKGNDFDETEYARLISNKFKTDHHEFYVSPYEFRDLIPKYVWHMDEPVAEAASISLYLIAKLAREFVTVVLSGEGSDEMFAGYKIYYYMAAMELYRKIPGKVREKILDPLAGMVSKKKLSRFIQLAKKPLSLRYLGVPLYDLALKESLYTKEFNLEINSSVMDIINPFYEECRGQNPVNQMLNLDIKTWLPDDLLIKADRMSMAQSLELRVPFLDHRIAEFAARMPVRYKLKGKSTKYILKKAMEGLLPEEIIYRPKKGFPTPLKLMFQNELVDYAKQVLLDTQTNQRGYFNLSSVEKMLDDHKNGVLNHEKIIWQLIVLEEWHRCFID